MEMMEENNRNHSNNNNSSNSNRIPVMDDRELEYSNQEILSSANIGDVRSSGSMDSLFDELLKDTYADNLTHTSNPPGSDIHHTHTSLHLHTKILPPPTEEWKSGNDDDSAESGQLKSKKQGRERGGNREAVRKYRQKKKTHAASLEDEAANLRTLNQQLVRRLHGRAALEAEIGRLKCLLVDIRGRIEGEIGSFPYQRPVKNIGNAGFPGSCMIPCNAQCGGDQIYCLQTGINEPVREGEGAALNDQSFSGYDFDNCTASLGSALKDHFTSNTANMTTTGITSGNARRKLS